MSTNASMVADLLSLHGLRRQSPQPAPESMDSLAGRVAQEDTQALASSALEKLKAYVAQQGLVLPGGWRAGVKVRITNRRHGRTGRTTTNTYYSPTGKAFRSHAAVVDALRLAPSSDAGFASPPLSDVSSESDRGSDEPASKYATPMGILQFK
ncbi:hypothetical protein TSOC_010938 [Tetrabaena socialis]|uniref:MBD domain-containing protein n=1 Tax=Tetrabaena socialis TaxID=47790 RepID=A0A2J7ZRZ7_9CHLO|nr:hypothetical protein TSOC_010938 [Tetrabaena socialis]|eukprot:PNH03047.1 hypothetical protein TSOC_010938 [Tetrabaena socialis]